MLVLFPDMKGPRRKDIRLKKYRKVSSFRDIFQIFSIFFRPKYVQNQILLPNFCIKIAFSSGTLLSKCHDQLYSATSVAVEILSRLQIQH